MPVNVENLIFEQLKRIEGELSNIKATLAEHSSRLGRIEVGIASLRFMATYRIRQVKSLRDLPYESKQCLSPSKSITTATRCARFPVP